MDIHDETKEMLLKYLKDMTERGDAKAKILLSLLEEIDGLNNS